MREKIFKHEIKDESKINDKKNKKNMYNEIDKRSNT